MATGDKILHHLEKDEIIRRLLAGESVRDVSEWLRAKYPKRSNMWVSYLTLQRFRSEQLNLKSEVLQEVKEARELLVSERVAEQKSLIVKETPAYQEAKLAIATDIVDRGKLILDLHDKIWQRMKMLEAEPINYKTETVITQYISEMRQLMGDYHKMLIDIQKIGKNSDSQVNVQVVMQQAESQINTVKLVVKEILQELEPALVPVFIEKMKQRLSEVQRDSPQAIVNVQVNNHA